MKISTAAKLLVWLVVIMPGLLFLIGSAGIMVYIYWPHSIDELDRPEFNSDAKHVVILAHGLKDTPSGWAEPLKHLLAKQEQFKDTQIIPLDWNPYARNTLRCAVSGKRIGEALAEQLLQQNPTLVSAHFIGHSCGAFVVLGLCEAIKEKRKEVIVQSTFLDPVSVYGGFFREYGLRHFGACENYSDAYIDTEDNVPGSNQLLPATHTFDVTDVRKARTYQHSPHVWPTDYYQLRVKAGEMLDYRLDKSVADRYPVGVLEHIE